MLRVVMGKVDNMQEKKGNVNWVYPVGIIG